jgi:hypothetical protein
LYARALGDFILGPTFEDFQDQVYEDFKTKHMRNLIFSFQSNEACVPEQIAPTYFFVYSLELELHVWKCLNLEPMLGFTRLDLSSLEAIEVLGSCHQTKIALSCTIWIGLG